MYFHRPMVFGLIMNTIIIIPKRYLISGAYTVSVQKDGYLPINFAVNIDKQNPFYINVVNLLTLPIYSPLPITFTNLSPYDDLFLLHIQETGSFIVVDKTFQELHGIRTNYKHI